MLRAREGQLMGKINLLEAEKSELEATVEIMQLEEPHSSDIEQLLKVHAFVWPTFLLYNYCHVMSFPSLLPYVIILLCMMSVFGILPVYVGNGQYTGM